MPQITRLHVSRVLRELLPQRTWTEEDLLHGLVTIQERTDRAQRHTSSLVSAGRMNTPPYHWSLNPSLQY